MIREYAAAIASKMNMQLSDTTLVNGQRLGCVDEHLLKLSANGQETSILVHQSDLDKLQSNIVSDRLEARIRTALSRLQTISNSPQSLTETHPAEKRLLHRVIIKDGSCVMVKNGFLLLGTIENISLGGLFVKSDIKAKVMDRIDVNIILPSDSGGIAFKTDVITTRIENRGIALKYDYLPPKELWKLKSYLHRLDGPSHSNH